MPDYKVYNINKIEKNNQVILILFHGIGDVFLLAFRIAGKVGGE
jgi:hypothetical protein